MVKKIIPSVSFKSSILTLLAFLFVVSWSCSDDVVDEMAEEIEEEVVEEEVAIDNEIIDFIWKGMNESYFWQADVPDLNDEKDDNFESYANFLNSYSNPEDFYESLIYQPGVSDRFSFYIDDFTDFQESRSGVGDSFGFDFGLTLLCEDCDEVLGFVRYVVPDSPAADARRHPSAYSSENDSPSATPSIAIASRNH